MRDAARCAVLVLSTSLAGCGTTGGLLRSPATGAPVAEQTAPAGAPAVAPEMRTLSGDVTAVGNDVGGLVGAVRAHAREVGGSVAREDVSGDAQHRQAAM